MLGQLMAVLQLMGLFATCLGAYLCFLEFLMPSSAPLTVTPCPKSTTQ